MIVICSFWERAGKFMDYLVMLSMQKSKMATVGVIILCYLKLGIVPKNVTATINFVSQLI